MGGKAGAGFPLLLHFYHLPLLSNDVPQPKLQPLSHRSHAVLTAWPISDIPRPLESPPGMPRGLPGPTNHAEARFEGKGGGCLAEGDSRVASRAQGCESVARREAARGVSAEESRLTVI